MYSTIKWLTLLGSWSPHAGKPISFSPPQRFLLYNTSKHLDSPKPADSLIRSIGGLKNSQNVLLMPKAMKGPTRLQTPYSSHTVLQDIYNAQQQMMGHLSKTLLVQLGSRWWRRETITCIYSAFHFTASRPDYTGWVGGVVFLKNKTPLVHSPKQLVKQLIW